MDTLRPGRVFILILIGWYLILALGHFFNQRPLWNDEQCVLNNIAQLKPHEFFTRPLLSDQAFPRLYLWLIQQFTKPFHQNLLSLRLFSLMAMIGAFFIWLQIACRVFRHSWDLILFIGCWCASMPLVYYAAELKPYSTDVLISGLIVLFLYEQNEIKKDVRRHRTLLFCLPLLGLWSYPAIFLLLLPLFNLIRGCFDERQGRTELSFYLAGCALALGLVFFFDLRVSAHYLMEEFWHDYFISIDSLKHFLNSFGKGMNNLVGRPFAESPRWVKGPSRIFIGFGVGYMGWAFWGQLKRDRFLLRSIIPISLAMFFVQLVVALFRVYPFAVPRMSLFYYPLLLLMTILFLRRLREGAKVLGIIIRTIFAGYLIFVSLGIAWNVFINKNLGAESTLYSHFGPQS